MNLYWLGRSSLHDVMVRLDSGDLVVGIDPEVRDDDLDIAEHRPARIELAGSIFEAVGGGVIGCIRVGAGEPGDGVCGGLSVREAGPVSP